MRYIHLVLASMVLALALSGCLVRTYDPHPRGYHAAPPPRAHCYSECVSWGYRSNCYGCRPVRTCMGYRRVCR